MNHQNQHEWCLFNVFFWDRFLLCTLTGPERQNPPVPIFNVLGLLVWNNVPSRNLSHLSSSNWFWGPQSWAGEIAERLKSLTAQKMISVIFPISMRFGGARSECGCCVASLFCQLYPNIWLWDLINTTNSDHHSISHLEYITSLLISKVDYFSKYSCFFLSIPFCTGTVHALSWSSNSICTQSIFIFKLEL